MTKCDRVAKYGQEIHARDAGQNLHFARPRSGASVSGAPLATYRSIMVPKTIPPLETKKRNAHSFGPYDALVGLKLGSLISSSNSVR